MTKKKLKRLLLSTLVLTVMLSVQGIFSLAETYGGERLYHFGLISGSGSGEMVLNEEKDFTREQLALIILEINGLKEEAIQKNLSPRYDDLEQIGEWARPFVAYCQEKNLMSGSNGIFNPKGIVTGKELGAVMLRALGHQISWNEVESKLETMGIPVEPYQLKRGTAFEYIWKAITLPITPDGKSLAVKLGKVMPEDIVLRFEESGHYGLKDGSGKIVLKPEYDYISEDFTYGIGYTVKDKKHNVINTKGEVLHDALRDAFLYFNDGMAAIEKNDKFGFIDKEGKLIIEPMYENAYEFTESVAWVMKDKKWILIDKQGHVVNDTGYDWIDRFIDGQALVQKDKKCFFIDKDGNILANVEGEADYQYGYELTKGFYRLIKELGEKTEQTLIDKQGNIIAKYDWINFFSDDLLQVSKNEKSGLIDMQGKVVLEPVYDWINEFSDDLLKVSKNEKSGLVDMQGKVILEPVYDWINEFSDDLLRVSKNEKSGLVDMQGKVILEPVYDWINEFSDDLLRVSKDEKQGLFDNQGNKVVDLLYTGIQSISENLVVIQEGGQYGLIDKEGKTVISSVYDWMDFLPDGNIVAFHKNWGTKESKLLTMDRDGKITSENNVPYDSMWTISGNSVVVSKDEKYGIADKSGNIIIEPVYDGYGHYSDQLVAFKKDGKSTLFDKDWKSIAEINDVYDGGSEFAEDFIQVVKEDRRGLIDKQGKIIAEPSYDWIEFFSDDFFMVLKDEKQGLVNTQGKVILEPLYDEIEKFENGRAVVNKDGKYGLVDMQGKFILNAEFNYMHNYGDIIQAGNNEKSGIYNKFGATLSEW